MIKISQKYLEIAIMFCFCHSFLTSNSAQDTVANATGSDFSASEQLRPMLYHA